MATETANSEQNEEAAFVKYWLSQLDSYYDEFKDWEARCEKIIQRYRDDRGVKSDGTYSGGARFNSLWSNVQTLQPAIYIKPPKPIIERRYLDKDTIARFSSMTLERSLEVTIEECGFHSSTQKAVQDYLLCGRGTKWNRYEPTYGTPQDLGPQDSDDEGTNTPETERKGTPADDDADEGEPPEAPRPVTWEKVYDDYVNWKNFRHSPSPVWEEVWWVSKREFLTRRELRTRFKGKNKLTGKPIADEVPLSTDNNDRNERQQADGRVKKMKRQPTAEVWEIWDKRNREVVFIATQYADCALERTPDPLGLQEFWPCPKPLYATTTTDTLVPVPDYIEYQDQADELDNLTARIRALTDALRVNGVYDASIPALKRILQEGADNRMIGVANWAEFAQKGGLDGAVDFIPLKDISETLLKLYDARERTKADMAEITGLSDIVRGQAQGSAKTATEQRIKGQFASLRLEDRKSEIARFCRDSIAISSEIIAEQFSPEILAQMTGMLAFIAEEIKNDPQTMMPIVGPMMAPPGMGHNGGPPMTAPGVALPGNGAPGGGLPNTPPTAGMQPPMQGGPPQQPQITPQMIEQAAQAVFAQCVELLKNDKMRTFRIDIETNSTIEVDRAEEKQAVVELFTAVGGFLEKSVPIAQMQPQLMPALGQSLLFAFRRFGVGRDVEGVWEQAIDKLTQQAKNPPPKQPSPEEIKAQAEMQKQQMENQRAQADAQRDAEKGQMDMQMAQQKHAMDLEKMQADLQIKRQELDLKREELTMKEREVMLNAQATERKAQIEGQSMERQAELNESEHERALEAGDHKHELAMEAAEFKAAQAKKPKPEAMA